jgi:hypothetical protein
MVGDTIRETGGWVRRMSLVVGATRGEDGSQCSYLWLGGGKGSGLLAGV